MNDYSVRETVSVTVTIAFELDDVDVYGDDTVDEAIRGRASVEGLWSITECADRESILTVERR